MQLFVPGRICLFGEHSDWAGGYRRENPHIEKGYTLICGTNQGLHAYVEPLPDSLRLTSTTPDGKTRGPHEISLTPHNLLDEAKRGGFWSYIAGTTYQVLQRFDVGGLTINNFETTLPMGKGLSSSAAVSVLTARAFNKVYDLNLSLRDEMELAYLGEITTPSQCGRMDQGCAFGARPILMTFDGDHLEVDELHVVSPLHFVIVDLNAAKDTQKILARLNDCYNQPVDEISLGVQNLLGRTNKHIVREAVHALQTGDAERIGELMTEAQANFDKYAAPACPDELTAPVLHSVLKHEDIQPHIWGGKGVGSQGDGSAQFITRGEAEQREVIRMVEEELGMIGIPLTINPDGGAARRKESTSAASK